MGRRSDRGKKDPMRSTRSQRGKSARTPSVWEIKRAICTHERLAPSARPEQRTVGGDWRTTMTCPTCGAWYIRTTAGAAVLVTGGRAGEPARAPMAVPS